MFYETSKNDHGLPRCPFKAIVALDRLEGQIVKSTELANDREFAKDYLRRRFPLT